MLNINIRSKLVPIKLLGRKLVVYKDTLEPRINRNIYYIRKMFAGQNLSKVYLVRFV